MQNDHFGKFYRFIRGIIRLGFPEYTVQFQKDFHQPVVYISRHQNLFGPFVTMLWFPKFLHPWVLHVFLDQEACYKQYMDYTFTARFGLNKRVAKIFAFPLSFFVSTLLHSGKGIPVFRGSRKILNTFQLSVDALSTGKSLVIFPDIQYSDASSATEIYDGFLYLEKYYYKATGKHVLFVPLHASKNQKTLMTAGEIRFRDGEDFHAERKRVHQEIQNQLNGFAEKCGDLKQLI